MLGDGGGHGCLRHGGTSAAGQAEGKSFGALLASLPSSCHPLDDALTASLMGGPSVGAIAQSQAHFASAAGGNTLISSDVAVFGEPGESRATYALYTAPTFAWCLQEFPAELTGEGPGILECPGRCRYCSRRSSPGRRGVNSVLHLGSRVEGGLPRQGERQRSGGDAVR